MRKVRSAACLRFAINCDSICPQQPCTRGLIYILPWANLSGGYLRKSLYLRNLFLPISVSCELESETDSERSLLVSIEDLCTPRIINNYRLLYPNLDALISCYIDAQDNKCRTNCCPHVSVIFYPAGYRMQDGKWPVRPPDSDLAADPAGACVKHMYPAKVLRHKQRRCDSPPAEAGEFQTTGVQMSTIT